ncbi:MAG: hypothetical protein JZU53_07035 [Paludibacter sp.]|nr:hypothetical protein [Paludibacter sp.]
MKIQLKGIVRNTSGAICPDGELEELVNVHFKDGTFRPVPLRSKALSNVVHTNIYIHTNSGFKHFLGVSNNNLYYFADEVPGHNIEQKVTPVLICAISGTVTFTQIGNVVNMLDSDGLKHAIWYDNSYKLINSNFDGNATDTAMFAKVDLKVDMNPITRRYLTDSTFPVGIDAESIKLKSDGYAGLHAKALASLTKDGLLSGYCLACTAIELYDGSYIMHSNPILLGQAGDSETRYLNKTIRTTNNINYDSYKAIIADPFMSPTYNPDLTKGYKEIENWWEYALYGELGGRNALKGAADLEGQTWVNGALSLYTPNMLGINFHSTQKTALYAHSNILKYKVNSNISEDLRPIIKSISVFTTRQVSMYKDEVKYVGRMIYFDEWHANYIGVIKTDKEVIAELSELSTFYKVKTIDFDDIKTTADNEGWVTIDMSNGILENITAQEVLTYDNFSHHQLLPEVQFVYNSKLHIGKYKNILSRGFPLSSFFCKSGIAQFNSNYSATPGLAYWIEVTIKTNNGDSKVVRYKDKAIQEAYQSNLSAFLSYPDARATSMKIHCEYYSIADGWKGWEKEYKLTAHKTQNYAYHISNDLKPISNDSAAIPFAVPNETQREQSYSNVCKVSEVNNPFVFPIENTYPIGNGQIIGFATNTIALSTGQAGQFPVYIFCTDGIYALYIGGAEVNYASSRPISREVCNNALSIKPVDSGVLFTTDEGIKVIAGAQVNDISEVLRGDYFDIAKTELFQKAVDHKALVQLTPEITAESILEYIASSIVGYNKKGDYKELWFTNPSKSYSYVFAHGIWHKVKQTGQEFINDYPKQYLLSSGDLIDLSSETGTGNETMFLTRPLKLGDQNFKQMLTCILHGHFKPENAFKLVGDALTLDYERYTGLYVFGSYDCQRWQFLGGTELKGERRDIGTITEKTSCKYFRVGFVGNLSLDSTIDYIEITGKQSILSKKER